MHLKWVSLLGSYTFFLLFLPGSIFSFLLSFFFLKQLFYFVIRNCYQFVVFGNKEQLSKVIICWCKEAIKIFCSLKFSFEVCPLTSLENLTVFVMIAGFSSFFQNPCE